MKKHSLLFYSLTALFVLLSCAYTLLYTTAGLSWYLNQNLDNNQSAITIDKVSHSLNGDYAITGLRYVTPRFQVEISKLQLSWNSLKFLRQEMDINSFTGESVSIHLNNNHLDNHGRQSDVATDYQLPFKIKIKKGSIRNLSLNISETRQESFHHVKFEQVYLYDNFFTNKMVFTAANGGAFEISGKAGLRQTDVINLTTKATFVIPHTTKVISSQGTVVGTPAQLRFLQHIKSPYASSLAGTINNILADPQFDFKINLHSLNGEVVNPYFKANLIQGEVTGKGSLSTLTMTGDIKLKDENGKWRSIVLNALLDEEKADFQVQSLHTLTNRVDLQGQWFYRLDRPLSRNVALIGTVESFSWPLDNVSTLKVGQGRFNYDGNTLSSTVKLKNINLDSTGTQLTKLELETGTDNNQTITLAGKADSSDGSLKFSGKLDRQALGYRLANLSLTGRNFTLVRKPKAHIIISPDLTFSRNERNVQSSGVIKVPTANIQLQGIKETYQQLATLFSNAIKINTDVMEINQLNLAFGKSVWLHGYGLNANVTGDLEIESLSDDQLVANGNLNVLRGNYTSQKRKFMLAGGLLKFENKQLDNPDLEIKVFDKQTSRANTAVIKGPLKTLHTAQDKAPQGLFQQLTKRIALNK
ncbi:translocation/assembly module TamB domain-containing protein [Kaarinaea lacus]